MGLRDRLIRGAGLAAGGFLLARIITFAGYVGVANFLAPAEVGRFASGTILIGIAVLFAESGMLAALIAWRGDVEEAASTAFVATLLAGLLLTVLALAAAPLIGSFFDSREVGELAAVASGLLLLRALLVVPEALLQRRFSFARRVVIDPLGALAFSVAAIVACADGFGAWGLMIGTYATFLVQLVAGWMFARWLPRRRRVSFAVWRRMAGFGRHIVASEVVRTVTDRVDLILLGRFGGAGALGQYTYGQRIAGQPAAGFISIAAYVLFPAFARVAEEPERFRSSYVESVRTIGLVAFPISLLLIPTGDQLALAAFGPRWSGAGDVIKCMALIGIGFTWASLASEAFKAAHVPRYVTRMHLVSLAVNLVAMPSMLWAGEAGVAAALSLSAMLSGLYGLSRSGAVVGVPLGTLLRGCAGSLAAALAGLLAALALDATVFAGETSRAGAGAAALVEGVALAAVFALTLRWVSPADSRRLADILGVLRRRRQAAA